MKLDKLIIHGFKSIQDNLDFYVRDHITCLVGANEHGKSNLLRAIHLLGEASIDLQEKNAVINEDSIPEITYTFLLSQKDKSVLAEKVKESISSFEGVEPSAVTSAPDDTILSQLKSLLAELESTKDTFITLKLNADGKDCYDSRGFDLLSPDVRNTIPSILPSMIPKTYLFAPSNQIADTVTIADLTTRKYIEFEGLLKLAGIWEEKEKLFEDGPQSDGFRIKASRSLTEKIHSLWSQGSHDYKFSFTLQSGPKIALTIEDNTGNFDAPSFRSLGFRAFFSFYSVVYAETYSTQPEGYIFLFDEPEVHLHPQAQKDLLKELGRLARNNQIIFSSHSPFMINRNDLQSTIVVKKAVVPDEHLGTRLIHKPYQNNWAPLRESLGMLMADSLLLANKSLFVEGTSDRVLILSMMKYYRRKLSIDLNSLSILDGDRKSEMVGIGEILLREGFQLLVMVDGDDGGNNIAKKFEVMSKRIDKITNMEILNLSVLVNSKKPMSIEDYLPIDEFCEAVSQYLKQYFDKEIIDLKVKLKALEKTMTRGLALLKLAKQEEIADGNDISKTTIATLFDLIIDRKDRVTFPDSAEKLCVHIKSKLSLEEED